MLARVAFAVLAILTARQALPAELEMRDLPALSIALPPGEITSEGKLAGAGSLAMSLKNEKSLEAFGEVDRGRLLPPAARQLNVQWDAFPLASADERRIVLNAILGALPLDKPSILREQELSKDRQVYVVGSRDIPVAVGFIDCGASRGVTVTMAFTLDLDALVGATARVLKSVACKQVTAEQLPKAAFRLPKNFGRLQQEGLDLFMSLEGEVMVTLFTSRDVQRIPGLFVKIMGGMVGPMLGVPQEKVSLQALEVDAVPGWRSETALLRTHGELDGAIVNVRYCKTQDLSLMVLWYLDGGDQAKAIERIRQVGCPGEAGEPVASLSELFGGECKGGNQFACGVLKEMGIE
ncbi:MAG TPA: hypothetical protein VM146_07720 [Steroidobacteraceae bacterium]|nr:hypothetical protein [Steroidobacteraceae bacterium]